MQIVELADFINNSWNGNCRFELYIINWHSVFNSTLIQLTVSDIFEKLNFCIHVLISWWKMILLVWGFLMHMIWEILSSEICAKDIQVIFFS